MPASRRDALKTLALPLLAPAVTGGCAGPDPIKIAVVWSGWELARFQEAIDSYQDDGRGATAFSVGDRGDAFLQRRVARSALPDVAIVSRPELLRANRDRLTAANVPQTWALPASLRDLALDGGTAKGTWVKIAHKSLVWYEPGPPGSPMAAPAPTRWDAWVDLCRELAARDGPAPLAIGAADGWVLTDWFENVLLGLNPEVFRQLPRAPELWSHGVVRQALVRLAGVWSIPGVFPGGRDQALTSQFDDSIREVFAHRRALMVAGADFAWPVVTKYTRHPRFFRFPPGSPHVLVGGDLALALNDDGARFVSWLAGAEGAAALGGWVRRGGFLSPYEEVRGYPAPLAGLPGEIRRGDIAFDLSDRLGQRVTGNDTEGVWKVLTDFFAAVAETGTDRERVDYAVEAAYQALGRIGRERA